jgi:hypothetical protein
LRSEFRKDLLRARRPNMKHKPKFFERWFGWWRNPSDRFAALIALFTAGLFAATLGLWLATNDLVLDAKEASERQLRAYVGISAATPIHVEATRISITMDNFGQTPANSVKFFSNWEFLPKGANLPADFDFPEIDACPENKNEMLSNGPIWPKNILIAQRLHCPGELEKLKQSEHGELEAFYYGHIEYLDIFRKPRRTNFCFLHGIDGMTLCDHHNEIDPDEKR